MNKKYAIYTILGLIILSSCSTQRGGNLVEKIRNGYYPYRVKSYVKPGYTEYGTASWYGRDFHGKRTSDGEIYDMYAMTAAHKTLPFNTYVKVTNLNNHREAVVRINDRGPFVGNRIIDLSYAAAKKLGMIGTGTAPVKIVVLSSNQKPYTQKNNNESASTDINENIDTSSNIENGTEDSKNNVSLYHIQIGSFRLLANALKLRDRASRYVNDVNIIKATVSNEVFYRVVIGSFLTRQAALEYAKRNVANKFGDFCIIGR